MESICKQIAEELLGFFNVFTTYHTLIQTRKQIANTINKELRGLKHMITESELNKITDELLSDLHALGTYAVLKSHHATIYGTLYRNLKTHFDKNVYQYYPLGNM